MVLDLVNVGIRERLPCVGGFEAFDVAQVSAHHEVVRVHAGDLSMQETAEGGAEFSAGLKAGSSLDGSEKLHAALEEASA